MTQEITDTETPVGWGTVAAWTFITGLAWACSLIASYFAIVVMGIFMGLGQMLVLQRRGIIQDNAWIWPVGLLFIWGMMGVTIFRVSYGASDMGFNLVMLVLFLLLHEGTIKAATGVHSWFIYPTVSLASAILVLWNLKPAMRFLFPGLKADALPILAFFLAGCVNGAATGITGFLLLRRRGRLSAT